TFIVTSLVGGSDRATRVARWDGRVADTARWCPRRRRRWCGAVNAENSFFRRRDAQRMNAHDGGDHERDRQRGEKRRQKAEARHRNLQLTTPGTARLNGSIRASKVSPLSVFIVYVPCIDPKDVRSGQKLVYSNDSPGL